MGAGGVFFQEAICSTINQFNAKMKIQLYSKNSIATGGIRQIYVSTYCSNLCEFRIEIEYLFVFEQ